MWLFFCRDCRAVVNLLLTRMMEIPVLVRCWKHKKKITSFIFSLKYHTYISPGWGDVSSFLFIVSVYGKNMWVCLCVCLARSCLTVLSPPGNTKFVTHFVLLRTKPFPSKCPWNIHLFLFYLILGCVGGRWQLGSVKEKKI